MSKLISIRNDLYEQFKGEGKSGLSSSQKLDTLLENLKILQEELNGLQDATITQEGRISKILAGKTILYKVKESSL